jgi:two-component sensor histidine kinase
LYSNVFLSVIEDNKGRYWAANWFSNGLYTFDPITAKAHTLTVKSHPQLRTNSLTMMYKDSRGTLYIAGLEGGFITFNPDNETFKVYHHNAADPTSVSNETMTFFHEGKNGVIWFGSTGGGLSVFDPANQKFKAFMVEDGLAHNDVTAFADDKKGNYWIGTRNGISTFTPPADPFSAETKINFRNYNESDGLVSAGIRVNAAFCDSDGTLYFGTKSSGLIYFHPDDLINNEFIPPVYITDFTLMNKGVRMNDPQTNKNILKTSIEFTKEILLKYTQNTFSFNFAALNYTHPEKNKYKYKLEGFDDDWIESDASKRFATYTNLNHGEYTFKVKASNNDGIWNEKPTELRIIIKPPFWQTIWFKIVVGLVVLAIAYAFYRYRIAQIMLLQRIRNKIAADLHDDIGSTLNSISIYSEVAKKDPSRKDFALNMIGESSRKIIDSMSDIVWSINPENDHFDKIILRMRSLAHNLLNIKDIDCIFKADESLGKLKLSMQTRRNFYLIFKEALNNMVKYSRANRASITLTQENQQVILVVRDNGIGFDLSERYNGNGLYNIRRRAHEINAKLSIESSAGQGTTIELNFKV